MYNTLNAITWQAADKGEEEISILSSSLGRFFRISLSKGEEVISLREEIEHVTSYLEIQSIRYGEKLNYDIEVDSSLMEYKVLKLILQPLAENSIYHGIKEKAQAGWIHIRAQLIHIDEGNDRLKKSALGLSGGQQQRICIARSLAVEPEVLLMDEPTSALDPISTTKIEDLMEELKKKYTVVVVTHNMQQAARVSDYTAFFLVGEMVEYGETNAIFKFPHDKRTEDYITGRFG